MMALQDAIQHNYVVIPPTANELTGYHKGGVFLMTKPLNGADLTFGSRWTITEINGVASIHALNAPSAYSHRTLPMSGFVKVVPYLRSVIAPRS